MKSRLNLALFTLLLILAFVAGFVTYEQSNDVEASGSSFEAKSVPTLVIEVNANHHGSIWKFYDGNRECYFNSAGGVWCTN